MNGLRLLCLLLLATPWGPARGAETSLAPPHAHSLSVTVEPARTSIYVGTVSLTMPPFARRGTAFESTYDCKVFPYFFSNEHGTLQIEVLSAEQVSALTTGAIRALASEQIGALSVVGLVGLQTGQVRELSAGQVGGLTTTLVDQLSTDQIRAITTAGLAGLGTAQVGVLIGVDIEGFLRNRWVPSVWPRCLP